MSIVLSQADLDYSGMKKIGRVTISERPDRVWIQVDGFEFDDLPTCRMQGARVIAWARDLLSAQLAAHQTFGECNLGDERRTKRLVEVGKRLANQIGCSLPKCCEGDKAALLGSYR